LRRRQENSEQRSKRLLDLKVRARRRRELVKNNETESEKSLRLAKQAQYVLNARRRKRQLTDEYKSHDLSLEKPSVLRILESIIEMKSEQS
jgi:hypothetical protein